MVTKEEKREWCREKYGADWWKADKEAHKALLTQMEQQEHS